MFIGWVDAQVKLTTWMRFAGGPVVISERLKPAKSVFCNQCGELLPVKPVDLMRLAG
jgi:hypothetical protein